MTRNLILVAATVLITSALAEIGLRFFDHPKSMAYGWPDVGAISVGGWKLRNQLGCKGAEILYTDRDYVIVLVGDSQVVNSGEVGSVATSPEALLEASLEKRAPAGCLPSLGKTGFRVFTVGEGGWGQDQQLLALRRYFERFRADQVILWESPENDLWNNGFPTHYPLNGKPKPTFVIDGDGRLVQVERSEIIPMWMRFKLGMLVYAALDTINESPAIDRISAMLAGAPDALRLPGWSPDTAWDKYLPPPLAPAAKADAVDDARYLSELNPYVLDDPIALEKCHLAAGMNDGSQRIEYLSQLTNLLIVEIASLSERFGAGFFAFSYAADNTDQPLYPPAGVYSIEGQSFSYSPSVARRRWRKANSGIEYHRIDLETPRWRRKGNDPHLSLAGNEEVCGKLAALVIARMCPS